MPSRWGPPTTATNSRNSTPDPDPTLGSSSVAFDPHDLHDFEVIDSVEWKNPSQDSGENEILAPKPKPDGSTDPCGCQRPTDGSTVTCCDLSCVLFACQEECRSNCEAGDCCGNKRLTNRQFKQLQVIDAGKKGKGLIVLEDVKKGELITEYVGQAVHANYLNRLFRRYAQERKLYIMALDKDVYLDARKKGGVARYINHSCEPNCVVERWKVRGITRAAIIALQDIPAGTELSFDYQWDRKRGRAPTKCHCGTLSCRGTLEVPKSMEELEQERSLQSHWKKPLIVRAGKEILNRSIKIWNTTTQEYYQADVTQYDSVSGKHLVLYQQDLEEVWEDLKQQDWMILDEEAEQFIISKKQQREKSSTLLVDAMNPGAASSRGIKNYIYVQTPIKELFWSRHLVQRCERTCRVTISHKQIPKPPLPPDPNDDEDLELHRVLEQSHDGSVWKLTIVGSDISKARNVLERNVAFLERRIANENNNDNANDNAGGTTTSDAVNQKPTTPTGEIVIPRIAVETVYKRMPLLRDRAARHNVVLNLVPSDSKTKQFAKLVLEATLASDIQQAQQVLWQHLLNACNDVNAPKSPTGMYQDLGYLGGELSSSQFQRLVNMNPDSISTTMRSDMLYEDVTRRSHFFHSFEATQKCTVWVQSDGDKGRIDSNNRLVNEASPTSPKKIFFGCDPQQIPKLWSLVQTRAQELERGVKYLHLGKDRVYQPHLMKNASQFLEFCKTVTGASVTMDSMTGDHLRIDGASAITGNTSDNPINMTLTEGERASMAEELILLQIELFRDHSIRQQGWIFGRDWTLSGSTTTATASLNKTNSKSISSQGKRMITSFDARSVSNACFDISEIASNLGLDQGIAAHATVILYRFLTVLAEKGSTNSSMKLREIALSCMFLANKASSGRNRWKRLEEVLEAAYHTFYPGSHFDRQDKEALVLEERVMTMESELLSLLEYDIFWRGFGWIQVAAVEGGGMSPAQIEECLKFCYSGPVLSAGEKLWLQYGAEYIFAAAAAFLNISLEKLCPVLGLISIKIGQAAELIVESVKPSTLPTKKGSATMHPIFHDGKKQLMDAIPRINQECSLLLVTALTNTDTVLQSAREERYKTIAERNCIKRSFSTIPADLLKETILPVLASIGAQSSCSISVEKSNRAGFADLILQGSWRSLELASRLLKDEVKKHDAVLPLSQDTGSDPISNQSKVQAKGEPGLLQMKELETSDGWTNTTLQVGSDEGRRVGGKACVPAKASETVLRSKGLRWWIPPRYGPSLSGSICDMVGIASTSGQGDALPALANLSRAFAGDDPKFSLLSSHYDATQDVESDSKIAISLQRWPADKVAKKEESRLSSKSSKNPMKMGFSAAALQEMQQLKQLHSLIPIPDGHPNFILPVGIALASDTEPSDKPFSIHGSATNTSNPLDVSLNFDDDIFSLTRTSQENETHKERERKRQIMVSGAPHLVFQPTPFVLQKFMKKRKPDESMLLTPKILLAWTQDLLAAVVHCHSNQIALRNFQPDEIVIDSNGVLKLGGLYRSSVVEKDKLGPKDVQQWAEDPRNKNPTAQASSKSKKDKRRSTKEKAAAAKKEEFDLKKNPYIAPEQVLGYTVTTKEADIWSLGCLVAHLLLNRPLFGPKDSQQTNRQEYLLSMYKIIGTPGSKTFPDAKRLPFFKSFKKEFGPDKKYGNTVEKAIYRYLKVSLDTMTDEDLKSEYGDLIHLIASMLVFDPTKRISAIDALSHEAMKTYSKNCGDAEYRQGFVSDWMALKSKHLSAGDPQKDEASKGLKRQAMLMAASGTTSAATTEEDDLYNMDDILNSTTLPSSSSKKARHAY